MLPSDGVLSEAMSPMYVVPLGKRCELRNLVLVNNSTAMATVNLYVRVSGNLRPVFPVGAESLRISGGRSAVEQMPLLLGPGHEVHGVASLSNAVTYVLCGTET